MNIVTHLLVGWNTAAGSGATGRDLALVAWAGAAPDLDGVGWAMDWAAARLGHSDTTFYAIHHVYGHGLPAALAISGLVAAFAVHKRRAALLAFLTVHLHLLCDVLGSRGLDPRDLWPVSYLQPFSDAWRITWRGQWPVSGWQNTVVTAACLALAVVMGIWRGVTPVGLFSARADREVVRTLRARWAQLSGAAPAAS